MIMKHPSFLQKHGVWKDGPHALSTNISEPWCFCLLRFPGLSFLICNVGTDLSLILAYQRYKEMGKCENIDFSTQLVVLVVSECQFSLASWPSCTTFSEGQGSLIN